ncbi:hypothetical protein [Actinomadura sp. 6K520]|uniref:hypothetical protein n=1 Tax=Actinomadura sp. 6K520 TaxID=2530364 RepID=UPI003261CC25
MEIDATLFGQEQGALEREFLDVRQSCLPPGMEREFDERGAREQDGVAHHVVGEPRKVLR